MYIYVCIHIYIYTHIRIYMCTYMYVCVYVYIHVKALPRTRNTLSAATCQKSFAHLACFIYIH